MHQKLKKLKSSGSTITRTPTKIDTHTLDNWNWIICLPIIIGRKSHVSFSFRLYPWCAATSFCPIYVYGEDHIVSETFYGWRIWINRVDLRGGHTIYTYISRVESFCIISYVREGGGQLGADREEEERALWTYNTRQELVEDRKRARITNEKFSSPRAKARVKSNSEENRIPYTAREGRLETIDQIKRAQSSRRIILSYTRAGWMMSVPRILCIELKKYLF